MFAKGSEEIQEGSSKHGRNFGLSQNTKVGNRTCTGILESQTVNPRTAWSGENNYRLDSGKYRTANAQQLFTTNHFPPETETLLMNQFWDCDWMQPVEIPFQRCAHLMVVFLQSSILCRLGLSSLDTEVGRLG
jgi:hypothetical protein